ncbi:hypothetical protein [Alteromonas sp. KUL49]|uniref:hypothetical protein n=1 Tax=Alteromonas sp. KUL49 TaxID=2480798 RepID=UPI00102F03F4|nr:hypothetical protein [Alteromonas sp. KUL49]TAP42248.1 hypothetical protein EYS00_01065 [Alteromonas sp. KUL49]GEA09838.1 hypothetical protein KUL49_02130 [Alteromonas sp. KUL49]
MKTKSTLIAALAILGLSGCASHSKDIQATYVSPTEYAGFTCEQMQGEMREISRRVGILTGQIDEEADADTWQMGVGLVLFWPALLFLEGGDGAQASEYALLKGKYEAVETQYKRSNCEASQGADSAS